ncbi:hypothetical protein B0H13DRAFT_1865740 [Mycena leptocephala]|nr:hypothetical protein B0H13DRAFT_1865740 [Mycena leptocephala]
MTGSEDNILYVDQSGEQAIELRRDLLGIELCTIFIVTADLTSEIIDEWDCAPEITGGRNQRDGKGHRMEGNITQVGLHGYSGMEDQNRTIHLFHKEFTSSSLWLKCIAEEELEHVTLRSSETRQFGPTTVDLGNLNLAEAPVILGWARERAAASSASERAGRIRRIIQAVNGSDVMIWRRSAKISTPRPPPSKVRNRNTRPLARRPGFRALRGGVEGVQRSRQRPRVADCCTQVAVMCRRKLPFWVDWAGSVQVRSESCNQIKLKDPERDQPPLVVTCLASAQGNKRMSEASPRRGDRANSHSGAGIRADTLHIKLSVSQCNMKDREKETSTCSVHRTKDSINSKRIFDIDFRPNESSCPRNVRLERLTAPKSSKFKPHVVLSLPSSWLERIVRPEVESIDSCLRCESPERHSWTKTRCYSAVANGGSGRKGFPCLCSVNSARSKNSPIKLTRFRTSKWSNKVTKVGTTPKWKSMAYDGNSELKRKPSLPKRRGNIITCN